MSLKIIGLSHHIFNQFEAEIHFGKIENSASLSTADAKMAGGPKIGARF